MSIDEFVLTNLIKNIEAMDAQSEPPEYLYHYTDAPGLLGIFKTQTLWLTNSLFLNDAREFTYTRDLFANELRSLVEKSQIENERTLARFLLSNVESKIDSFFSFSLSGNTDQLSQWRAYTSHNGGYSIGFRTTWLKQVAKNNGLRLFRVQYDDAQAKTLFNEIFSDCSNFWPIKSDGLTLTHIQLINCFSSCFSIIGAQFKHPAFREEDEWRLATLAGQEIAVDMRARGPYLVPYTVAQFKDNMPSEGDSSYGGCLFDVWVGPGVDHVRSRLGLECILGRKGLLWKMNYSSAPYRIT